MSVKSHTSTAAEPAKARRFSGSRLAQPLHQRSFRRLAIGKLASHLGDWLTAAALVGWLYAETASTGQVALLLVLRIAPLVVGGGVAAAIVDRLPKRRLVVWIEIVRGIVVSGALAGVMLDSRLLVFTVVAISGALASISSVTVRATVPTLVDDEQLPAANATLGIAQETAMAAGAVAAGVVLTAAAAQIALVIDLATFAIAAILYRGIDAPAAVKVAKRSAGAGLRYLVSNRLLLVMVCAFATATLATGLTNATLPRLLGSHHGLGAGGYGFGLGAIAVGLVIGETLVGLTGFRRGEREWMGLSLLAMAGLFVALGFAPSAVTALALLVAIGIANGVVEVVFDTTVQREADPGFHGRVFGFSSLCLTTTMMGAVAAAPVVNRLASPGHVILIAGFCLAGAAAVALSGAVRTQVRGNVVNPQAGTA